MKNFKFYESKKIHDLREMLQSSVRANPNKPVFYEKRGGEYTPITYSHFYKDINTLGAAFIRRGLLGKKIIITGDNCYAWCVSYMATVCGLGVVIPVDKEIPAEELANIAKVSGASAVIFSEKCRQKAMDAGRRLQKYSFETILDICDREDVCSEEDFEIYANTSIDIDEMAVLIFGKGLGLERGIYP